MKHFEDHVHDQTDDKEIDEDGNKIADLKCADGIVGKVLNTASEKTEHRIHDIVHERLDQFLGGTPKDEADGKPRHPALAHEIKKSRKLSVYMFTHIPILQHQSLR